MNSADQPLLSVVIPIYNTEKYLRKCLDSIACQTYGNLEIICVNDCSPGNAKEIVSEYTSKDHRFKYVEHPQNKGLFHARITGSEIATGDYIAFVDSDDYISIDYYRLLLEKAVQEKADIVEGRIIRENEDGYRFVQNLNNILVEELSGDNIREAFFSQEGLFYHWHVIWNKVYSKALWDQCLPYYKKQTKHLIMTEDFVFSSLLFINAKKYCSIPYDGYFYLSRAEASTGSASEINKFLKTFEDMGTAFDFVEQHLRNIGLEKYVPNVLNWKTRYFRLWASRIKTTPFSAANKNLALNELKKFMKIEKVEETKPEDYYHSIVNTAWDPRYEVLKNKIADEHIEYISFDIFDTLVVRPFYNPRDLLFLLDDYFHEIYPASQMVEFSKLRLQAESKSRELVRLKNPSWQDVNLDEIYQQIAEDYQIPAHIVDQLKKKEIELELKFTYRRESIYQLYKMARVLNKKVIFVSDMYLSKDTVQKIIEQAGYVDYEKLYVSSETRVLKNTGDMFDFVIRDLGIEPHKILHIGDNWHSDKVMAEKKGWHSFFTAKPIDLLTNNLSDKETGNSMKYFADSRTNGWSSYEFSEYMGIRCMLALAANKLFDNPYPSFNPESDFNIDPYFVGYYALGIHVFSLVKWIIEDSMKMGYETLHFIARDGYLPFIVYEQMAKYIPGAPKANYLYASRKMLMPYMLTTQNAYGLESFVSIHAHTPQSILELFKSFLKDDLNLQLFEQNGVILYKNFSTPYEFKKFIDVLMEYGIDSEKVEKYKAQLEQYYNKNIGPNDAAFDLGYSARLQTIIVNIIKRKCDAYFVHTAKETPWRYARRNHFELKSYYEYKPLVSGILREHLFAELGPSCIGVQLTKDGDDVEPIFEEYHDQPINRMMITILHNSAVDFAKDMMSLFSDYMDVLKVRNKEASVPLEMFIHYSRPLDRLLFKHSGSDDTVHGGKANNNLLEWWNRETSRLRIKDESRGESTNFSNQSLSYYDFLYNRHKIIKAIFYALFDRDTLKEKVKARYASKPKTLKFLTVTYRGIRKIKRSIVNRR